MNYMTRDEVIETLCILMRDVHQKRYGWDTPADCICSSASGNLTFANSGDAVRDIERVVRQHFGI